MADYCQCSSRIGWASLRDEHNTFVCSDCGKPSRPVWLGSERFCEECGCSIYTRWELICLTCTEGLLEWVASIPLDDPDRPVLPPSCQSDGTVEWVGWPEALMRARKEPYGIFSNQ